MTEEETEVSSGLSHLAIVPWIGVKLGLGSEASRARSSRRHCAPAATPVVRTVPVPSLAQPDPGRWRGPGGDQEGTRCWPGPRGCQEEENGTPRGSGSRCASRMLPECQPREFCCPGSCRPRHPPQGVFAAVGPRDHGHHWRHLAFQWQSVRHHLQLHVSRTGLQWISFNKVMAQCVLRWITRSPMLGARVCAKPAAGDFLWLPSALLTGPDLL